MQLTVLACQIESAKPDQEGYAMKLRSSMLTACALAAVFLAEPLRAEVLESSKQVGDTTVHYKTVLPDGYDPAKAYPAILVMGGGPQTMSTVDGILERNFRAEAEKRGYIVIGVAAPDGDLFFEDGARVFPEFMWEPSVPKLQAIAKMCVFAYVGELDPYMWHGEMKREVDFLSARGTLARFSIEKGQPHRLDTLAGPNAGRLFDGFEEAEKGCSK
jgi:hypothetical protein